MFGCAPNNLLDDIYATLCYVWGGLGNGIKYICKWQYYPFARY